MMVNEMLYSPNSSVEKVQQSSVFLPTVKFEKLKNILAYPLDDYCEREV